MFYHFTFNGLIEFIFYKGDKLVSGENLANLYLKNS